MLSSGIRLFNDFDRAWGDILDLYGTGTSSYVFSPHVDVYEDADAYTLVADVPGVELKDLSIEVKDRVLIISGERPKNTKALYEERRTGRFSRSFSLSKNSDSEHVDASLSNGVLTVKIAKKATSKPKKIDIKGH